MKLKPVQTYPAALLKGRVAGEPHTALTACTAYYRDTTDRTIKLWFLVVQVFRQFLDTDRAFQAWWRRTKTGRGAGPTTS
jgi:hypothetical protein